MKKNYAYKIPEKYDDSPSSRLWRLFNLCLLCILLSPALSYRANAQNNTDNLSANIESLGSGYISCDYKEVTLLAMSYLNGTLTTEGITYNWVGPDGFTSTNGRAIVTTAGQYELTIRHTSGLSASANFIVRGVAGSAGGDRVLKRTDTFINLEAERWWGWFITPSWTASDGGNIIQGADTFTPTVNAPGTYTLTLTSNINGCTMQDQVVVTGEEIPYNSIIARIDRTMRLRLKCSFPTTTLSGDAWAEGSVIERGIDYKWSGPDGFRSNGKTATVSLGGEYILTVTDQLSGAVDSDTVTVEGPVYPTGSAGPDKKLTCSNSTVTLEGKGGPNVIWHASDGGNIVSGARTHTPIVNAPGTYTMVITDILSACKFEDVVVVTRDEGPAATATGGSLDCASGSIQLTGTTNREGMTYSWTGPNGFTSSEQNPTVRVVGDYTLTVTDPETNCSTVNHVVVTPAPSEMQITQHLIDFNGQKRGLISSIDTDAGPVAIVGRKRNADGSYEPENYAAIFDTQDPTGDDANLYTVDWGEALIINQYHSDYPDANQWGGELILDFSATGPVTMESLKVVGMDAYEQKSWVYLYDGNGKELHRVYIKPLGRNSRQTVNLGNTRGVMKMKIVLDGINYSNDFSGSAAIDDIKFHQEKEVGTPCAAPADDMVYAKAYPTTFNDRSKVEFISRETGSYAISLYDTQGMLIARLQEGISRAGEMTTVEVDGRNLKEGMYIARLVTDSGAKTFRLILKR